MFVLLFIKRHLNFALISLNLVLVNTSIIDLSQSHLIMAPSVTNDQVAVPQADNAPQTQVTLGGKVIASMFFAQACGP